LFAVGKASFALEISGKVIRSIASETLGGATNFAIGFSADFAGERRVKSSNGADTFVAGEEKAWITSNWEAFKLVRCEMVASHTLEALESVLARFTVVKGALLALIGGGSEESVIAGIAV
jgi:hypothetical protein